MRTTLQQARTTVLLTIVFLSSFGRLSGFAQSEDSVEGIWLGTVNDPQMDYRVVFKIFRNSKGELAANIDFTDFGAVDIPVDKVSLDASELRLVLQDVMVSFTGSLFEGGSVLRGVWKKQERTDELALNRVEKAPNAVFP